MQLRTYTTCKEPRTVYLLQRHAFAIKARLAASLVLAYALPAEVLKPLLAPGLKLDTYGEFGFLAIALVETRALRPAFLPEALGLNFFLAGYRIFTRYQTPSGRTLRGLRILRSDTDRRSMELFGNLLTHYGYERSRCEVSRSEATYAVKVRTPKGTADLHVEADLSTEALLPPQGSPFPDLREARKFAGPLPFTFDYERQTNSVIRVEGVRQEWKPKPVTVAVYRNTFLEQERFRSAGAVLANAFYLENVPYAWRPGVRDVLP
jgi:hypothetical protein